MKGDISYKVWVEVEEVTEGAEGTDPGHRTLLDVNSTGHGSLEGALEAGISSLIAAKHQRAKEQEEAFKLLPIWHTDSGVMLCGSEQAHASGLDLAPRIMPEGRLITDVQLPKFDATELDGIRPDSPDVPGIPPEVLGLVIANAEDVNRGGQDAPEPLPVRTGDHEKIPSAHYACTEDCAARGHVPLQREGE